MRIAPALAVLVVVLASAQCLHAAPLEAIRDILRRHLLDPPDEAALAGLSEDDLQGRLRDIDPYARIISGGEYRTPLGAADSWIGIGAGLAMRAGGPVLHVYRGGGAERAGVPDRVRLLEIDGASVRGQDAETIASGLRGEAGSTVRLRVALPGGGEKSFTVRREAFCALEGATPGPASCEGRRSGRTGPPAGAPGPGPPPSGWSSRGGPSSQPLRPGRSRCGG